jgi:hypothetical protein
MSVVYPEYIIHDSRFRRKYETLTTLSLSVEKATCAVLKYVLLLDSCRRASQLFIFHKFNCLYRWHATTGVEDEQWTQKVFGQLFQGKPSDEVTVNDFKMAAIKVQQTQPDVKHWTFGEYVFYFIFLLSGRPSDALSLQRIKRGTDGGFKDADLANILHNS